MKCTDLGKRSGADADISQDKIKFAKGYFRCLLSFFKFDTVVWFIR